MSPSFPVQTLYALQTPNPPFWTTETAVPKFPQNGGSMPTPCLDKAVHAQEGEGGNNDVRPGPSPFHIHRSTGSTQRAEGKELLSVVYTLIFVWRQK